MQQRAPAICIFLILMTSLALVGFSPAAPPAVAPTSGPATSDTATSDTATSDTATSDTATSDEPAAASLPDVEEARGRARLLHETIHSTLQVVHHQYYREDEGLLIPAATMKRVFAELARRQQVELRWLAVDAQVMNSDHAPNGDFETKAVAALSDGKTEYEQVSDGIYRRAGTITLTSDCLKCHLPTRTSTEDRLAGLVITMKTSAP